MMSSYEERCSSTSTPGREAYRRTASGPERSDGQTERQVMNKTDRWVTDHVYLCLVVTGYWSCLPVSCCGSLDTRTCASVCWRLPSVHTGYTHELDTDQTPRTNVLWGTEPLRERSDSHAPSPQTADHHHWDRQVRQADRWDRQVNQTGNIDRCVCFSLTVIVPPLAACWGSGQGHGPLSGSYHPPCASDADSKLDQWRSETSASSPWTHYTEPDHRSIILKTLKVGQFAGFWI